MSTCARWTEHYGNIPKKINEMTIDHILVGHLGKLSLLTFWYELTTGRENILSHP